MRKIKNIPYFSTSVLYRAPFSCLESEVEDLSWALVSVLSSQLLDLE